MNINAWTLERDTDLRRFFRSGLTDSEIAAKTGRTSTAIKNRRNNLGLRRVTRQIRGPEGDYTAFQTRQKAIAATSKWRELMVRYHHAWMLAEMSDEMKERVVAAAFPTPIPRLEKPKEATAPETVPAAEIDTSADWEALDHLNLWGGTKYDPGRLWEPTGYRARGQHILIEVSRKHHMTPYELKSTLRKRAVVRARHEAYYRMRTETALSSPVIGKIMGGRDHTAVLYGAGAHARKNGLPMPEGRV